MNDIENEDATEEFAECWNAAIRQINSVAKDSNMSVMRGDLYPPMLEHLSFRIGNQLFHIRVHDVDGVVQGPGNLKGFRHLVSKTGGHPCIIKMKKDGLEWIPVNSGWGMTHLDTDEIIDPAYLVSDEKIPISDWELYDFAVMRVKTELESKGLEVTSWLHWDADLMPSIWFRQGEKVEWAVVRAGRYPNPPSVPEGFEEIKQHMAANGFPYGNFFAVTVAGANNPFDPDLEVVFPIYRGEGLFVKIEYPSIA